MVSPETQNSPQPNYDNQGYGIIPPRFVRTQDTLAQWIMALLAFAATGISVWAVVLIKKTLDATRETVGTTRRIGEAQVRAYLSIEKASFSLTSNTMHLWLDIRNTGNSPTLGITANVWGVDPGVLFIKIESFENEKWSMGHSEPENSPFNLIGPSDVIPGGEISWNDVFDSLHVIGFELTRYGETRTVTDKNGEQSEVGDLTITEQKATFSKE